MSIILDVKKDLDGFSLDLDLESSASRIGILGASGSGKSMTLRMIAGIERPDSGRIEINGRVLFDSASGVDLKPQQRRVGYMFQSYALFPTMTVMENICCGIKGTRAEQREKAKHVIDRFRLTGLEERLPDALSGGQQQRVALARIMANEPDVLLLDEPSSALDVYLKDRLQRELEEMLADYNGIMIMVSHSRDEIYRFADETAVIKDGRVIAHKNTKQLFADPGNKETAILTGCKNFTAVRIIDDHTLACVDWEITVKTESVIPAGTTWIGYRAHDFIPVWETGEPAESVENSIKVRVVNISELPFETNYYIDTSTDPHHENADGDDNNYKLVNWFVQRDMIAEIKERGLPDRLKIDENRILFLKD